MVPEKTKATLTDVSETMLWTLHNRAVEAMREDGVIEDEKAVEIYQSIEYDYERSFGKAEASHAFRSIAFDDAIKQFLAEYPDGTIVNLGEGLETQHFRVGDNQALWVSIDLPEAIEIRERFIQPDEKHLHIPLSVMDRAWFDSVPKDKPVFITAQGLFMYFTQDEVKGLMQDIVNSFGMGYLMFDTIPNWLSQKTMSEKGWKKTEHYTTPKMPWGINRNHIQPTLKNWLPNAVDVADLGYPLFPRGGITKWLFWFFSSTPVLKNITPSIVKIKFAKTS